MELHHLKGNTYYIDGTTNIGLYKLNDKDCALIDSGFAKVGPQIYEILKENKLYAKMSKCSFAKNSLEYLGGLISIWSLKIGKNLNQGPENTKVSI